MRLFFDTETTGVPKVYGLPISNVENYPRLVQLGYIVVEDGEIVHKVEYIVKPDGFEIPIGASNVHGVTTERALADGADLIPVLDEFTTWVNKCDTVIGHNVDFDVDVIGAEFWRLYGASPLSGKKIVCTMKSSTNFVAIPKTGRYPGYKWPKLAELYRKLFDEEMGAAHTALQDIENTVRCYNALIERGILT